MTSDTDELDKALQENLKLRTELVANVARTEAAHQRGGVTYRLGWVLYWTCIALLCVWVFGWVALLASTEGTIPEIVDEVMREPKAHLVWFGLPTIVLYGLGRAFRYVLSGE